MPGKFYAKLFVQSEEHTYTSGKSKQFIVQPTPITIWIEINPAVWPNCITPQDHGIFFVVTICGNESFNVRSVDPKTIRLCVDDGTKRVKPLCWRYICNSDGYEDLMLMFIDPQVVRVFKLFKNPEQRYEFTIIGYTFDSSPLVGHGFVEVQMGSKYKK
jgi:hypothetical protein